MRGSTAADGFVDRRRNVYMWNATVQFGKEDKSVPLAQCSARAPHSYRLVMGLMSEQ